MAGIDMHFPLQLWNVSNTYGLNWKKNVMSDNSAGEDMSPESIE